MTVVDTSKSFTRSVISGAAWMSIGRLLTAVTNIAVLAILARLLSPADFGLLAIPISILGLCLLLADGSFGMVLLQKERIGPGQVGASLLLCTLLGLAFAVIIAVMAPAIADAVRLNGLTPILQAIVWVLPISSASAVGTAILQRHQRFRQTNLASVFANLAYGLAAVAAAIAGLGVWALVLGSVTHAIVQALLVLTPALSIYGLRLSSGDTKEVWRSGGMFTVSNLLSWGAANIDRVILGRAFGAHELGLYVRAVGFVSMANSLIGTGSARVLMAAFSRFQDDRERIRSGIARTLGVGTIISGLACAFIILHSRLVVDILLGDQWTATVPIMQLAFLGLVARSGYRMTESVPLSMGLVKANSVRQGIRLILLASAVYIGSNYGIVGAAAGLAIGSWLFYAVSTAFVMSITGLRLTTLALIHGRAAALVAPPIAVSLALSTVTGTDSLVSQLVSAFGFLVASLLMILFGPGSLVGADVHRARTACWQFLSDKSASFLGRGARSVGNK